MAPRHFGWHTLTYKETHRLFSAHAEKTATDKRPRKGGRNMRAVKAAAKIALIGLLILVNPILTLMGRVIWAIIKQLFAVMTPKKGGFKHGNA